MMRNYDAQSPTYLRQMAQSLIKEYRSKQTTLGRLGVPHSGVATKTYELIKSGMSVYDALARSQNIDPKSVEGIRISSLLVMGGMLELLIRRYPRLSRSGLVVGLLSAIVFASHSEGGYVNAAHPETEPEKERKEQCTVCGGDGEYTCKAHQHSKEGRKQSVLTAADREVRQRCPVCGNDAKHPGVVCCSHCGGTGEEPQ